MAAKFVVLALAVASASAGCLSSFQDDFSFGQCGEATMTVEAAPRMEFVQAAPRMEIVQSAPKMEIVQSAPRMEFIQSAPRMEVVQSAPRMEIVGSGSTIELASAGQASTGPQVSSRTLPVVQAPPVTLNAVESPMIRLPSPPVPAPRVIRHQCYCTKTVVRPQVIQRTVTVPRIQRYLKQSYKPVVENFSYQARPVGNDYTGEDIVIAGSSSGSSSAAEVSFPVRATEVAIPVRAQEVAIPVRTQEVVRAPVSFGIVQESGDCQCEQSFPRCY